MSQGVYDIAKTRKLIAELDALMATNPKLDHLSADLIIRNLVAGLKNTVNTIEYLREQMEIDARMLQSMTGRSNAKH